MQAVIHNILALDVGSKRIGLALANSLARLPRSLDTIHNDDSTFEKIKRIIEQEKIDVLVIGLPRGLDGQETQQTAATRDFANQLLQSTGLRVHFQDEALTSYKAKAELAKTGKIHDKAAVDALAATYILEDFLNDQPANPGEIL